MDKRHAVSHGRVQDDPEFLFRDNYQRNGDYQSRAGLQWSMAICLAMDGETESKGERKCGTKDCSLAREHFRHLPDTRCTGRLSSPSVKSRSRLTQEISPASGLLTR